MVRYCSPFLSNTFTNCCFSVSVGALWKCAVQLCCGNVQLWSSIKIVWFTAAIVSRSWLKKEGRPLSMTVRPCVHAEWEQQCCEAPNHISLSLFCLCSSVPQQGSSCWWLEALQQGSSSSSLKSPTNAIKTPAGSRCSWPLRPSMFGGRTCR